MFYTDRKLLILAWIQALFYATTGLWPIVHIDSFMALTGPKTDIWLVQTVGALLVVSGLAFAWAARRKCLPVELIALAIGQAAVLAAVDVVYVSVGRISPIYLLDAAAEVGLISAWLFFSWRGHPAVTSGGRG